MSDRPPDEVTSAGGGVQGGIISSVVMASSITSSFSKGETSLDEPAELLEVGGVGSFERSCRMG